VSGGEEYSETPQQIAFFTPFWASAGAAQCNMTWAQAFAAAQREVLLLTWCCRGQAA